ncbi:MAG TPA: TetR family transcriptional regulator [Myxococcota bacterium]|jgi:AcrR family transcriptional regulator|nr:TetR family transcriptional regulator [Myxococcota bacterium]
MGARATFQRARRPDQKAERRAAIVRAAAAILEESGLEGVSLNAVARRAAITKSNVYRYFESREAILLELLIADEARWVERLERALAGLRRKGDPRSVGRVLAKTIAGEPRLCALVAILFPVLEKNLSEGALLDFKLAARPLGMRVAEAIGKALPALPPRTWAPLQRYLHAVIAGLYPIAHPVPAVAAVLARPELADGRSDFREDLEGLLGALLSGLVEKG